MCCFLCFFLYLQNSLTKNQFLVASSYQTIFFLLGFIFKLYIILFRKKKRLLSISSVDSYLTFLKEKNVKQAIQRSIDCSSLSLFKFFKLEEESRNFHIMFIYWNFCNARNNSLLLFFLFPKLTKKQQQNREKKT